jgi:hypothetical protein
MSGHTSMSTTEQFQPGLGAIQLARKARVLSECAALCLASRQMYAERGEPGSLVGTLNVRAKELSRATRICLSYPPRHT